MNNFWKWVLHSVVGSLILGGIALLLKVHPTFLDETIGGMILALYNFLITASGSAVGFSKRY